MAEVSVEQILERYPQLAGFIDHPELGQLLRDAAAEGIGAEEMQGRLHKTEWYRTTWADFRRWEVLKSTDPAEYTKQAEAARYEVGALAKQLGINFSQDQLTLITENYLRHGKDDWFLFSNIGEIISKDPKLVTRDGQLAAKSQTYREWAADYGLDYTEGAYTKHAVNAWRKVDTDESLKERMRQEAIKRYGHLADGLKRGLTVRELISPVMNVVARTLEIDPEQIDPMDTRWRQLWSYMDKETNAPRMMTQSEADRFARLQPEFEKTKTARDEVYQASQQILQTFGAFG